MKLSQGQIWLAVVVVILILTAASFLGATGLNPANILDSQSTDYHIFWNLRVSRVLVAFLAGSGLALCGLIFQTLFLNTLATPYTLGVAGGAGCGAALVIFFGGLPGLFTGPSVTMGAMLGATLAMALVVGFSHTRMGHQRHVMLLAGVAVSFFFSSLLLLIQSLSSVYQSFQIIRWLMGGISVAGYSEVLLLAPVVLAGAYIVMRHREPMNMLLLGDDLAHTRGLEVTRVKRRLFVVVSILVACIVSITGPIGFVGLVVPHICRLIWGSNHSILIPTSLVAGGALLVLCDLVARVIMAPSGIPVGVITALFGAPFFFFLLVRKEYKF